MTCHGRTGERACRVLRDPHSIEDARRFAGVALTSCNPACREATAMAVEEFAENLTKYSADANGTDAGLIVIRLDGETVEIRASSAVMFHEDAECVVETIAKIRASPNLSQLYLARLQELFADPTLPRAQIGLLRVAFEGGFRLRCTYAPPLLSIAAERSCAARP